MAVKQKKGQESKLVDVLRARLNSNTDRDIMEDLAKAPNMTERIKAMYRRGMSSEVEYIMQGSGKAVRFRVTKEGKVIREG